MHWWIWRIIYLNVYVCISKLNMIIMIKIDFKIDSSYVVTFDSVNWMNN